MTLVRWSPTRTAAVAMISAVALTGCSAVQEMQDSFLNDGETVHESIEFDDAPEFDDGDEVNVGPQGDDDTIEWVSDSDTFDPYTMSDGIIDVIQGLEVNEDGSYEDYDRSNYPHWGDPLATGWPEGTNGSCNVRAVTLFRDGIDTEWYDKGSCIMDTPAYWVDQFGFQKCEGCEVLYAKSEWPEDFDIDHIVPLAEGEWSGASEWDEEKRRLFANDPLNVHVASQSANRSKGAQDASSYLPPGHFRCEYVDRYSRVKDKYNLTVTQAEKDALVEEATKCIEESQ